MSLPVLKMIKYYSKQDNINECRLRLLKVIIRHRIINKMPILTHEEKIELIKTLRRNIVLTPLSKYPKGSLDYDFEFSSTITNEQAEKTLHKIKEHKLLDQVTI